MENVPVKISEKYKPPPRIYQLPQSVVNKLQLPDAYYYESPQYSYNFHLEKKVLTKIPDWKRMRHLEREARRERKEKRKLEKLTALEAQQKQLLGAVSYPSTEELSSASSSIGSGESDSGEGTAELNENITSNAVTEKNITVQTAQNTYNSFNNILQPTILSHKAIDCKTSDNSISIISNGSNVLPNAFNYEDFEYNTASPFDNIELKTINDLDILAECLHNTQLEAKVNETLKESKTSEEKEIEGNENDKTKENTQIENYQYESEDVTRSNKKKVDFTHVDHELSENVDIPKQQENPIATVNPHSHYNGHYNPHNVPQNIDHAYLASQFIEQEQFNNYNNINRATAALANQNNLYTLHCNNTNTYYLTTQYQMNNANTYNHNHNQQYNNVTTHDIVNNATSTTTSAAATNDTEFNLKAKSVPDILKELSDEVRNSEMRRRSRNYSCNNDEDAFKNKTPTNNKSNTKSLVSYENFTNLDETTQHLATSISLMGFPLERVSRIAKIYGANDKKIVEHLIPLSEIIDLGFDETKISEALIKFDNNKEKALDYLIS